MNISRHYHALYGGTILVILFYAVGPPNSFMTVTNHISLSSDVRGCSRRRSRYPLELWAEDMLQKMIKPYLKYILHLKSH